MAQWTLKYERHKIYCMFNSAFKKFATTFVTYSFKRVFSKLNNIKTKLRETQGQNLLEALWILFVEEEIVNQLITVKFLINLKEYCELQKMYFNISST